MQHLNPKEAYEFLQRNPTSIFIDCRSEMEFLFVGHPTGAIMIPWNDGPDWEVNPDFVSHVKKAASVGPPAGANLPQRQFALMQALRWRRPASRRCTTSCTVSRVNSTTYTSATPPPAGVTTDCLGSNANRRRATQLTGAVHGPA